MIGRRLRRDGRRWLGLSLAVLVLTVGTASAEAPAETPAAGDNRLFRATVLIRKGNSQGSGSVIASVAGETLVLTAAHVVQDPGDLTVELHRYNLGVEQSAKAQDWPRRVPAELAATDPAADVALVRIRRMVALPFVARLAPGDGEPPPGTAVTSLGIDQATHLSSWRARVRGVALLDPKRLGSDRPFLVTDRAPEHGRSGGGLFLEDGTLVGVCVGRVEVDKSPLIGVFASGESIRGLLRSPKFESVIARSARAHVAGRTSPRPTARPPVTETEHRVPVR